ncbi:MAG TPA: transcription-repair coupling factor, partial [Nitratifractor sp.]|nr:transcription-repair coupling factor [Nitratifractor sp.]
MNQSSLYEYLKNGKQRAKIVIVAGEKEAQRAKAVYEYMDLKSFELPDIRLLPGDDTRSYMEDISKAFNQLRAFEKFKSATLIAPFRTLTMFLPKPEYLKSFTIEFGASLDLEELKSKLYYWGYEFVDVVSAKGEVSIRGDIVDIFPPNAKKAVRVALFDSEVEEIRHFDISTQKREKEELESVEITAAFLSLSEDEYSALAKRVERSDYSAFVKDIRSLGLWHLNELAQNYLNEYEHIIESSALMGEIEEYYTLSDTALPVAIESFRGQVLPEPKEYRDLAPVNLNALIESHKEKKITIVAKSETQIRASALINIEKLNIKYSSGVLNIIGNDELILSLNQVKKQRRVKKSTLVLDEIKVGEYVVHENYGVGVFKGIEKREVLGRFREFVALQYQNEDMLYIPVENLEVIDRYVASSGSLPT